MDGSRLLHLKIFGVKGALKESESDFLFSYTRYLSKLVFEKISQNYFTNRLENRFSLYLSQCKIYV